MEEPPKKYFRLFPGNEVRLMNAYFVTCTDYVKDENGKVIEVHCTYDPETRVEISQAVRLREQYTGFLLQKAVKLKSDYTRIS